MARMEDGGRIQDELIDAYKWGEEARARALVFQLGAKPDEIRAELEAMLEDSSGLARQAAAFGLGELGGAASVRRLDQQFFIEEARGDYDGEAVMEAIAEALGRIDEPSAWESLVRRLERLVGRSPERSDLYVLARMLWRRRHPDLIPAVRWSLEQGSLPEPNGLRGLRVLLEKSPEELAEWARDPAVPVQNKTEVLVVLGEDLPDAWVSPVLAFITVAQALSPQAVSERGEAAHYCERLFGVLLMYRNHQGEAGQQPRVRPGLLVPPQLGHGCSQGIQGPFHMTSSLARAHGIGE
ncbi:MAG TPA: HEAT repeat domain-containing protein [Hyalangium sp.]|nr:HEAT repeat domain-containing protein [Hyalangium sp.]HYH96119.1 HEAT repeat domain-containing protein [Hyalangium sp.]